MSHSTTTLDRIVRLYDQARQLLDREEGLSADDQQRFREIRAELDQRLWPERRAELVRQVAGPPRLVGGGGERDQQRAIAHGIAPLPGGR